MRHFASLAVLLLLAAPALAAEETVKLTVKDDAVEVTIGGKPFTTFHTGEDLPKPFFSPVRAADGTIITRPLENPADHPHHKGIWLSIDEVNGVKFWAEKGKIRNISVKPIQPEGKVAKFEVVNHWQDPETQKPILVETTVIAIHANRLVTYDVMFAPGDKPVTFEDTKEGLFGIRLADPLREKVGGKVANADGLEGTKQAWGKTSKWVDYTGEIDGKTYGVALMDHPDNFRPSRYHVRDYGLFSMSPFGEKSYTGGKSEAEPVTIQPGKWLFLRYGLYVHNGPTAEADIPAAYEQFISAK